MEWARGISQTACSARWTPGISLDCPRISTGLQSARMSFGAHFSFWALGYLCPNPARRSADGSGNKSYRSMPMKSAQGGVATERLAVIVICLAMLLVGCGAKMPLYLVGLHLAGDFFKVA